MCKFTALVMAASFALLLALVWKGETDSVDRALRNWALSWNSQLSVAVWQDISIMGSVAAISGLTIVTLCVVLLLRDWQAARLIVFTMSGAVALDTSIKLDCSAPKARRGLFPHDAEYLQFSQRARAIQFHVLPDNCRYHQPPRFQ